jgi:hypothetical protein
MDFCKGPVHGHRLNSINHNVKLHLHQTFAFSNHIKYHSQSKAFINLSLNLSSSDLPPDDFDKKEHEYTGHDGADDALTALKREVGTEDIPGDTGYGSDKSDGEKHFSADQEDRQRAGIAGQVGEACVAGCRNEVIAHEEGERESEEGARARAEEAVVTADHSANGERPDDR